MILVISAQAGDAPNYILSAEDIEILIRQSREVCAAVNRGEEILNGATKLDPEQQASREVCLAVERAAAVLQSLE